MSASDDKFEIQVGAKLADIPAADWDRLAGSDDPFLSYAYFETLESNGLSGAGCHFDTVHAVARDTRGSVVGILPLYLKADSWGEFVFDFAWANAYARAGRDYYPKLVTAIPYTPVGGRRILLACDDHADALRHALIDKVIAYARANEISSWHVLFCHADEQAHFERAGLLLRRDCQFHWFNRGYRDFDDYLASFRAARRKKTRRERRRVAESGIDLATCTGSAMSASDWQDFYGFYASSFLIRNMTPYFPPAVFPRLAESLGERMLVTFASRGGERLAGALFFVGTDTLYGRYWGASGQHDSLHFETCYYQGIEHCLRLGLARFDPGTQGEHKIARGFRAQPSCSAHWIGAGDFRAAIADYLRRERLALDDYMMQVDEHLPFRDRPGG